MKVVIVVVQVLVALVVVASVMPFVLVRVPATQQSGVGPVVIGVAVLVCFLVIRFAWPGRRKP